jgi:GntR family transcriptional repressor for pyruvate dehydrogenase complex
MHKRPTLCASLVREIQRRIATNEFKPGEKLPPENDIAAMFGISRTVVREAIKQLALMGFVRVEHGKGMFVSSFDPRFLAQSLSPFILTNREMTFDLLEARQHIETIIAYLAATRRTPHDIAEMKAMLAVMREALRRDDVGTYAEKNLSFHMLIAKASRNTVLAMTIETFRHLLKEFMADFMTMVPGMTESAMNYHVKIFRAIEKGDALSAQKHMRNHILHVERSLREHLNNLDIQSDGDILEESLSK